MTALQQEVVSLRQASTSMAGVIEDKTREIVRLRKGLNEVRDFLNKPGWGTHRYMESSEVYEDKDAALFSIAYALGETEIHE